MFPAYIEILNEQMTHRKRINPSYSLRQFARFLNISPSALANILTNRYKLSHQRAIKFSERLDLPPNQCETFLSSVLKPDERCTSKKKKVNNYVLKAATLEKVASSVGHLVVLNALSLNDELNSVELLSNYFGMPQEEVIDILKDLVRCNFIQKIKNKWKCLGKQNFESPNDMPSLVLRNFHRRVLAEAQKGLGHHVFDREFQSMVFKIDPKKMPDYKTKIRQFVDELEEFASCQEQQSSDIYIFSAQLFPARKIKGTVDLL